MAEGRGMMEEGRGNFWFKAILVHSSWFKVQGNFGSRFMVNGHREGEARCEVGNKSCYEPCKNSCSKSEYSLSISVSSVVLRRAYKSLL